MTGLTPSRIGFVVLYVVLGVWAALKYLAEPSGSPAAWTVGLIAAGAALGLVGAAFPYVLRRLLLTGLSRGARQTDGPPGVVWLFLGVKLLSLLLFSAGAAVALWNLTHSA